MTIETDTDLGEQAGQVEDEGNQAATTEGEGGDEGDALSSLNEFLDGDGEGNDDAAAAAAESGTAGEAQGESDEASAEGKGDEGEAEAKGEAVAVDAQGGKGEAKTPDPIADPIPEDVKGKTRERMQSLIDTVKQSNDSYTALKTERDELVGMITETGVSADQFGRTLETLKFVNSRDPATQKKGLAMLREDVNRIAALVGEDVGDTELLKRHQDLLDEVQSGDITEKRAREIALARESQKTRQQQDHQTNQQAQQQAKLKRETDAGLVALDKLETELKLKDTDYVRKRAVIVPAVKGLIQRAARAGTPIPASEWAGLFRDAYDNLKLPPVTNGAGNGAQPLRGRQPAGSGKQQPKSGLEALDMALEEYDVRASR